jgi:tetratricopeptide (TPR) repeat protein/transglutaminase-like putative cysteine protease
MFRCSTFFPALCLGVCCVVSSGPAQTKPEPPPASKSATPAYDYSREAVVFENLATIYDFNADGTGEKTTTFSARIQSDAAVRQLGVINLPYAAQNEHPEIVYLRVHKKDGSVVQTPPEDAQDMPSQVSRLAPFYSDLKEKQIPVKSLSPGDSLEYQVRFHLEKAQAPNQFWGAENFATNAVVLSQTVELRVPKDKYVLVLSPKAQPVASEENGKKIYRWKTAHPEPTPTKDDKDKKDAPKPDPNPQPTISWTTFKSWEEVGAWYGGLSKDRIATTAELKAKVDELTKGKTTDEEKMQAIYDYVSTQVRYIGVAFGIGRYQPHSAVAVMDNQYGDCKDKHTLLAAMLKTAGYEAWPALISDSIKPNPDLPSPGQFDHVITVVPRGSDKIWLDSTPEISPYRMLIYPLRDKQALVIPDSAPASLMRTPASPPFPALDTFEISGKLDSDGTFTAHMNLSLRGDSEIVYREIFHQTSRTQWNDVVQNISQNLGFAGTINNVDVSVPEHTADPFHYSYDYTRKEYSDWANRRIQPATLPFILPSADDDDKPSDEVNLGAPLVETSHSVIELPPNYTAELPKSVKYSTAFATYQTDYKVDDKNRLITDRRVEVIQSKVPVSDWDTYKKFAKNVQDDQNTFIQLAAPGIAAAAEEISNPDAEQLVREAYINMQSRNFDGARSSLNQAEKLNPRQLGLWAAYGALSMRSNNAFNMDEVLADYKKEVSLHPGTPWAYRSLASMQITFKKYDDAELTLRSLLKITPNDAGTEMGLGSLLMQQKKYDDAANLLTAAQKATPDNKNLAIQAGRAEILAGKSTEGEAVLRAALDGATDPFILNDAAYELADSHLDLDLAEASCKKALELLDKEAAQFTLENLSNSDLRRLQLLTATWDTMGWIYFRKGNLHLAEDYVYAAWFEGQNREVGDHLGQIYEKQGRKQDAANIYALAQSSSRTSPDPSGRDDMEKRFTALKNQGIRVTYSDPGRELGEQRSVYIPKLITKYASAEFFIELSPGKVDSVNYIRGDESLKPAEEALRKAEFHVPFPKDSQAKLIRRGILVCSEGSDKCQFAMLLPQSTTTN